MLNPSNNNSIVHSYRKYIPNNFQEVCGQKIPIKILENIINIIKNKQQSPPSLIFSGIYGIGKTVLAKLFAKAINCIDGNICNKCENCLNFTDSPDIWEVDGATYTGVDNIRNLLSDCQYEPIELQYKVYIIDEVHMLSRSAFNSLLKTLENPPQKVIFIFATTDISKIEETVLSRCLVIPLKPLSNQEIEEHIHKHITIKPEIVQMAIENSNGSLREVWSFIDIINLMDIGEKDQIKQHLNIFNKKHISEILKYILDGEPAIAINMWHDLHKQGYSVRLFFKHIAQIVQEISQCILKINDRHNKIINQYNITSSLIVHWIDIILKQHILFMNGGDYTPENTIFLMSFVEDQCNITYEAQKAFPNMKITL